MGLAFNDISIRLIQGSACLYERLEVISGYVLEHIPSVLDRAGMLDIEGGLTESSVCKPLDTLHLEPLGLYALAPWMAKNMQHLIGQILAITGLLADV